MYQSLRLSYFRCSSRRSGGSKAVMFTDEIGEMLVEVKKYVMTEPLKQDKHEIAESTKDMQTDEKSTLNNVENVNYIDALSDYYDHAPKKNTDQNKIFGNPNIKKSQSFNHAKRPEVQKNIGAPDCTVNSPLNSSVTNSPMCSPELNPRMGSLTFQNRSIKKSQSFRLKIPSYPFVSKAKQKDNSTTTNDHLNLSCRRKRGATY